MRVAAKVASRMGTKTSVGWAAPICALYTMMDTGMMVSPEVLSTRNIIMGFVAVALSSSICNLEILPSRSMAALCSVLSCCMLSIALRPRGVAALSSPSMLAAMFMKICPVAGCPLGMSGKRRTKRGLSMRERALTRPPLSPTFMTPIHRARTPVSPREISNAVLELSNVEPMMSAKMSVLPPRHWTMAHTAAKRKKAIQM